MKDGGVFVKYKALFPSDVELDKSALELRDKANEGVSKSGGIRTWLGSNNANIWAVRGKPWKEVCTLSAPTPLPALLALL